MFSYELSGFLNVLALSNYRHLSFTQCCSLTTSSWPAAKHTLSRQQCKLHQTAPGPPQQTPCQHISFESSKRELVILWMCLLLTAYYFTMYTFSAFRLRIYLYLNDNSGIKKNHILDSIQALMTMSVSCFVKSATVNKAKNKFRVMHLKWIIWDMAFYRYKC